MEYPWSANSEHNILLQTKYDINDEQETTKYKCDQCDYLDVWLKKQFLNLCKFEFANLCLTENFCGMHFQQ